MPCRPYNRVPTSPSRPPVDGRNQLRRYRADHAEIKPQIDLPSGRILYIRKNMKSDLILGGGKITLPVPELRWDLMKIDKWEITAGTIVIIPSDYPGGDPELRLSNWNCEGHSFGLAILSLTGLVRAAQGGVYFCMGQNGKLKEMNRAEWLWNLIPAE